MVVLEVFPRPQAIRGSADVFYIKEVNAPPGPLVGKTYAGVFGVVTEKVEPVMGGDKAKCKLSIAKTFEVAYYHPQNADWKPVTATLPHTGTQQDGVIYYFPSSCENAWQQIGEIKKKTNLELQTGVLDYYTTNSREIGMAVVKAAKRPK